MESRMKRFITIAALIIAVIFAGQSAFAQSLKFGHINRNELIQAMPEFDSAKVTLEKLNTELTNAAELLQVELNNKYEAYLKGRQEHDRSGPADQGTGTSGLPEKIDRISDQCPESDAGKTGCTFYSDN